jgi:plasmid maintenance system antidote protein VapI
MVDLERQLRDAARKSGLSMLAMSQRADIPYAAVHSFIARERGMTLATASKLATLLGLELRPSGRKRKAGKR